jgi:hypothetical protein
MIMALIDKLWLATETRNQKDAGTKANRLNLTMNVDGEDVVDMDFKFMRASGPLSGGLGPDSGWLDKAQAALSEGGLLPSPIESNLLTNSSIRLGIRTDNAWGPKNALVLGRTERQVIALAMETELGHWLSTDVSEGKLTMPLRRVGPGSSSTLIQRVMLLAYTQSGKTDKPLQIQITAGGNQVLQQTIADTAQDDLEDYTGNWYVADAGVPFTRSDVLSNGSIVVSILGSDWWTPKSLFVYGLDTAAGRPNEVVDLVSIPEWTLGKVGTVNLPVI